MALPGALDGGGRGAWARAGPRRAKGRRKSHSVTEPYERSLGPSSLLWQLSFPPGEGTLRRQHDQGEALQATKREPRLRLISSLPVDHGVDRWAVSKRHPILILHPRCNHGPETAPSRPRHGALGRFGPQAPRREGPWGPHAPGPNSGVRVPVSPPRIFSPKWTP